LLLLPLGALLFSSFLPLDFARQRGTASQSKGQTSIEALNKIRLEKLKETADAYRRTLDGDPSRLAAWQGLARTLLKMNSVSEAEEAIQKAQALAVDNAETECIAGDVYFRRSQFDRATAVYQAALKLDAKLARGYLGLGRLQLSDFNSKSARNDFARAFELDPADPEIIFMRAMTAESYNEARPLEERYLSVGADEKAEDLETVRDMLTLRAKIGNKRLCVLKEEPREHSIPLILMKSNKNDPGSGVAIKVTLNNRKTVNLDLDSGASGIILRRSEAKAAGITAISGSFTRGIGDEGTKQLSIGIANSVKIGDLEFTDCAIRMSDQTAGKSNSGIIGTDVFERFLIQQDFPNHVLRLSPLPPREGVPDDWPAHMYEFDRAIPPQPSGATPIRIIQGKLVLDVSANDVAGSFLIDTGAFINVLAAGVAKRSSLRDVDSHFSISGISGKIKQPKLATAFQLAFANLKMQCNYALALDLGPFSDSIGAEISGFLGYDTLSVFCFVLDYRDGLVRFM